MGGGEIERERQRDRETERGCEREGERDRQRQRQRQREGEGERERRGEWGEEQEQPRGPIASEAHLPAGGQVWQADLHMHLQPAGPQKGLVQQILPAFHDKIDCRPVCVARVCQCLMERAECRMPSQISRDLGSPGTPAS